MKHLELLRTSPILRRLCVVQFLAYFGSWFSHVAIYSMLVHLDASAFLISLVVAMHFIPTIVISPFSGAVIDRIHLKKLMLGLLVCEGVMTVCFLWIEHLDQVGWLMLFVFIRMAASSVFFSSSMSLIPKIVDESVLERANEIHSIIWSLTYALGMAISGVIVNAFGFKMAFIMDTVFFVVAFLLLLRIPLDSFSFKTKERLRTLIQEGVVYLRRNPYIIHLMILHSSIGLTAFDTLITLLADYKYQTIIAVPLAIGLSNAFRALALMIGPLVLTHWVNKRNLPYLFIVQGLSIVLWAMVQNHFYYALMAIFITGFTTTTLWSYTYALLQKEVNPSYMGRVIAYNDMLFMIVTVMTTFFIGSMATLLSLQNITLILGTLFFFVAYYYTYIQQKYD